MTESTYNPALNPIAAQTQAETDARNGNAPRDTTGWDHASATVYRTVMEKKSA
jgi:hypothetical protein